MNPSLRVSRYLVRILSLTVVPVVQPLAAEHVRLASFNIAEFGEGSHPDTRDLRAIAKMLVENQLDLIAIQEVGTKQQGEEQVAKLTKEMNKAGSGSSSDYFYLVTPQSGDERCAVIYRSPVEGGDEVWWLDDDKDPSNPIAGGKKFYRIPVAIPFRAGKFDFVVVIVHLHWSDRDRRKTEVLELKKFLKQESDWESDWIVMADMNCYGGYNKSDSSKAFDKLLTSGWSSKYRFPLLEVITDPDDMKVWKASQDAHSTTVAASKNVYDQIIISAGAFNEFGANDPALGADVGIIAFDMQEPYSSETDHNTVKFTVSDHRPIWIRFRTDLPDDDG